MKAFYEEEFRNSSLADGIWSQTTVETPFLLLRCSNGTKQCAVRPTHSVACHP